MRRPVDERRFLSTFASLPAPPSGLSRAAVLLARTECADADPERVEAILQGLAARVREKGVRARTARERAEALAAVLAGDRRLRGNQESFDDPRNSCIECVLDRRVGIPLALSLVWMSVGRRAGWRVEGVGLPGHFVVRVHGAGGGGVLADPFHEGEILGSAAVRRLLARVHGRPIRVSRRHLESLRPRDILLRMLRNLRSCYQDRRDSSRALAVAEDMLILAPDLPEALRDRALLRLDIGDRQGGVSDLRRFLLDAPDGAGAEAARRLVSLLTDDAELPN